MSDAVGHSGGADQASQLGWLSAPASAQSTVANSPPRAPTTLWRRTRAAAPMPIRQRGYSFARSLRSRQLRPVRREREARARFAPAHELRELQVRPRNHHHDLVGARFGVDAVNLVLRQKVRTVYDRAARSWRRQRAGAVGDRHGTDRGSLV